MTVDRSPQDDRKPGSTTAYRIDDNNADAASAARTRHLDSLHSHSSSGGACSDNEDSHLVDSIIASTFAHTAVGGAVVNTTDDWKEDLSNLLTPQTVVEQAQVQRRKRNREAARRSRQKQKEREAELVERQAQLSERLKFLQQELVEWRMMNANAPNRASNADSQSTSPLQPCPALQPPSLQLIDPELVSGKEDGELAENINHVYSLTMDTLRLIGELQLQLDDITRELNEMVNSSPER
ncbi:hypothetical protein GGI20_005554 [Coemansia sp. BCRC 34301]|nr:hypothetical protein GGI20_005554 [Coemansia sp. BCRC 34301]